MKKETRIKYIAGVGASAGGLEAMLSLFSKMKPTGHIAFVVAQHMAKDGHDELVVRLIARESQLPVVLATDRIQLLVDTVYIIPSGKDGQVVGDVLHLIEPKVTNISTPSVNVLFSSLAESVGARAIGIILSGTGSDGLMGCRAIKMKGGMTLAQDLDEAKFNGMPSAALNANVINHVFSIEALASFLIECHSPQLTTVKASLVQTSHQELEMLCNQVYKATGIDFSEYKEETLLRRIEKRKASLGLLSAGDYQKWIQRNPEEVYDLQQLFLVSVSSFFRDKESFDCLEVSLKKLVNSKMSGEPIRIWVAGCATGEEAYTLAIILKELTSTHPVEIIASDLNPEALAVCQKGIYKASSFKEMDQTLQSKYFIGLGDSYEIIEEIKSCVRFEHCNLMDCNPTPELDLISCRNLLIYFKSSLQDQLIKKFYNVLKHQGMLFIGQSESLSFTGNALFEAIDNYHRLFRKRG